MCVKMAIARFFAVDPTANSKQGRLLSNCTAVCVHNFRPLLIFNHISVFSFPGFPRLFFPKIS